MTDEMRHEAAELVKSMRGSRLTGPPRQQPLPPRVWRHAAMRRQAAPATAEFRGRAGFEGLVRRVL